MLLHTAISYHIIFVIYLQLNNNNKKAEEKPFLFIH